MKNKFIACTSLAIALLGFTSCEKENESLKQSTIESAQDFNASVSALRSTTPDATNDFSYKLITFVPNITVAANLSDAVFIDGSSLVWEQDSTPKRNADSYKENEISKVVINGKEVNYTKESLQRESDVDVSKKEITKLSNFIDRSTGTRINTIQTFVINYRQRHDYLISQTPIEKKYGIKRRYVGTARNQSLSN